MIKAAIKTGALALALGLSQTSFAMASEDPIGTVSAKASDACFSARAVTTNDTAWKAKWDASTDKTPEFPTINTLNLGTKATVILLFSCPELVEDKARIECDLKMTRANGSVVFQQGAVACFNAPLTRPREGEHLAEIWLDFDVTAEDGVGPVDLRIGLTDANLGLRLPMTLQLTLTGKESE